MEDAVVGFVLIKVAYIRTWRGFGEEGFEGMMDA
jgi:hypothetical protein